MIDVERPVEVPASLIEKKRYDGPDVKRALHSAFLRKCYLCELNVELGTFDIDHRRPKADDQFPELAHSWANLFPTCTTYRCNSRRERKWPEGGLLDPAGGDGVERRIAQRILGTTSEVLQADVQLSFVPIDPVDIAARNTARELDRIHNATASTSVDTALALRKAIVGQVCLVWRLIRKHAMTPAGAPGDAPRAELVQKIGKLVSREAPFTMLVRSCFERHELVCALFD